MSKPVFKLEFSDEDLSSKLPGKIKQRRTSSRARKNIEDQEEYVDENKTQKTNDSPFKKLQTISKKQALVDISDYQTESNQPLPSKMKDQDQNEIKRRINQQTNEIDWYKIFLPKSIDDLLIHPKKLEEIKEWFSLVDRNPVYNMLLLIGPSGCCKLSSIQIIGQESGYNVSEFKPAYEIDYQLFMESENYKMPRYETQVDKFTQFLFASSRFSSLLKNDDRQRLMVIKEFPNKFLLKGCNEDFWNILRKYKAQYDSPVVFIVTETNSKLTDHEYTLFPDAIRNELGICTIKMNSIALTVVKKTLKKICAIMSNNENCEFPFIQPTQDVIDKIAIQSQGDIRSAIHNLHMVSQKESLNLSIHVGGNEKKKQAGKKSSVKSKLTEGVGRDEQVDIFHGIGRVMYPKLELDEQSNRMKLTNNPETIAEQFFDQSKNFIELVHSNYMKHFNNAESIASVADILSISDTFQSEYRQAEELHKLNLCMIVRGTMIHNTLSTASGFKPIKGYANKKFRNVEEKNFEKYLRQRTDYNGGHRTSLKDFFSDFQIFTSIIKPNNEKEQVDTVPHQTIEEPLIFEDF